jgi:LysR family glycine cleavage system transcriptional activator
MPGNLIMTGVRRGDGINYTARTFFMDNLEAGKVAELLFGVYYILTPQEHERPKAKIFLNWLKSKAKTVSAPISIG